MHLLQLRSCCFLCLRTSRRPTADSTEIRARGIAGSQGTVPQARPRKEPPGTNPAQELTAPAGLTATDLAHLHGSHQSPPPWQRKRSAPARSPCRQRGRARAPPHRPVRGCSAAGSAASAALCPPRAGSAAAAGAGLWGHRHSHRHGSAWAGVNIPPLNDNRLPKQRRIETPPPSSSSQRPAQNTHPLFRPKHRNLCPSTGGSRLPDEHCRAEAAVICV